MALTPKQFLNHEMSDRGVTAADIDDDAKHETYFNKQMDVAQANNARRPGRERQALAQSDSFLQRAKRTGKTSL